MALKDAFIIAEAGDGFARALGATPRMDLHGRDWSNIQYALRSAMKAAQDASTQGEYEIYKDLLDRITQQLRAPLSSGQ